MSLVAGEASRPTVRRWQPAFLQALSQRPACRTKLLPYSATPGAPTTRITVGGFGAAEDGAAVEEVHIRIRTSTNKTPKGKPLKRLRAHPACLHRAKAAVLMGGRS